MDKEWIATCKDCGDPFGYSDASIRADEARGYSRPERCSNCRKKHNRQTRVLGLAYYELQPIKATTTPAGAQTGLLGSIQHPPRDHSVHDTQPKINEEARTKDERIKREVKKLFIELRPPECQVAIVKAPTGLGKSTFLPYRLIFPPEDVNDPEQFTRHGQVVVTQPRQGPTEEIANYVATSIHGSSAAGAGYDVGFQYHDKPASDRRNKLVYVTDGILLNWIVSDQLSNISVIIIDEVHERNANIDLILGLLKTRLSRYPHLKLIIVSATMSDPLIQDFKQYFGGTQRVAFIPIDSEEPSLPAETEKAPGYEQHFYEGKLIRIGDMPVEVGKFVVSLLQQMTEPSHPKLKLGKGDILAFLHGVNEIQTAIDVIREKADDDHNLAGKVDVYPYHRQLTDEEKKRALQPRKDPDRFRVVISTNLAETSLTPEGITYVVDSGLIKQTKWDPKTKTEELEPAFHSQSGCQQRWGRVGRTKRGEVYCLYTQDQFKQFSPDTVPEIQRICLEEIVLKAKAAGIDNIFDFGWFQEPDSDELRAKFRAELRRSETALKKRKALDDDGNLTEHGLELHWLPEEPDWANLLIIADQFACAVEMATLLPMIRQEGKQVGLRRLLVWDQGWDAATKYAISCVHKALAAGCIDDLDFYLKLFAAWEGLPGSSGPKGEDWAKRFFANQEALVKVSQERENLLSSLSAHKKSTTIRPVDLELLDRVRAVFAIGLPDRIYSRKAIDTEVENDPSSVYQNLYHRDPVHDPPHASTSACYRSVFPEDETAPNLEMQISPDSLCFEKPPELILCAGTHVFRKRLSPFKEPQRVAEGTFVVSVKPEWLKLVGAHYLMVAGVLSTQARGTGGSLLVSQNSRRLLLDQWFPLGARYKCHFVPGGESTPMVQAEIGKQVSEPPEIRLPRGEGEVVFDLEIDETEEESVNEDSPSQPDVPRTVNAKTTSEVPLNPEDDEPPLSFDGDNDNLPAPAHTVASLRLERQAGLIPAHTLPADVGGTLVAEVVGYSFDGPSGPSAILRPLVEPDPFSIFAQEYKAGQTVTVEALAVVRFFNDPKAVLLVREIASGLEVVLSPDDLAVIGRGFATESFSVGQRFQVVVEGLDAPKRQIQLSRLPFVLEDLLKLMADNRELVLPARIVEVRDNGVYVQLDPEHSRDGIVHAAFARLSRLPQRAEASLLGKSCRVKIRFDPDHPISQMVPLVPEKLIKHAQSSRWGTHITCDLEKKAIQVQGRMTYAEKGELWELSDDEDYHRAISFLFKRSNEPFVKDLIDPDQLMELQREFSKNPNIRGRITGVTGYGIYVRLDDGIPDGLVRRNELPFVGKKSLNDFSKDEEVDVTVKKVDLDKGQIELTMRRSEEDPLNLYLPGKIAYGVVREVRPKSFIVDLEYGGFGYVPISKMSHRYVSDPSTIAVAGQRISVLIECCEDSTTRYFELSMKTTVRRQPPAPPPSTPRPAPRPRARIIVPGEQQRRQPASASAILVALALVLVGLFAVLVIPSILRHYEPSPSSNPLPLASANVTPTKGYAPLNVSFDGTHSSVSSGNIISYHWDFGDSGAVSEQASATHKYWNPGTYFAWLTVTGDKGTTARASFTITVADPNHMTVCEVNCPFKHVQDAINAVASDGTVTVLAGTYSENLRIEKSISLEGTGSQQTVLTGDAYGYPVISISAASSINVRLNGITVSGARGTQCAVPGTSSCPFGITIGGRATVSVSNAEISDNAAAGIHVEDSAQLTLYSVNIDNNGASNPPGGLQVSGSGSAEIDNSMISGNGSFGLGVGGSGFARVQRSKIVDNPYLGVYALDSSRLELIDSEISQNGGNDPLRDGTGIGVRGEATVEVLRDILEQNDYGVIVGGASHTTIIDSAIRSNWQAGILTMSQQCGFSEARAGEWGMFTGSVVFQGQNQVSSNGIFGDRNTCLP